MAERAALIAEFLAGAGWGDATRRPLAMDASFRRYERLTRGEDRAILMDAPPPQEDVRPFLAVQRLLAALDLSVPAIYAEQREHGLLLLEDFGDGTYTRLLAAGEPEEPLYALAIDVLAALHQGIIRVSFDMLPAYDTVLFLDEAVRFVDWYPRLVAGHAAPADLRADSLDAWRAVLPAADRDGFLVSCAVVAAQRHAKNIGQFARLHLRDGKPQYLVHIPRMWRLLEGNLRHPALAPVRAWFDAAVPPAWRRVPEQVSA